MPAPQPQLKTAPRSFRLEQSGASVDLYIYDVIGEDFFSCGISASDVAKQLAMAGTLSTITVHINSPGGSAFDGLAIYNTLCQNPANVIVEIEGIAASAASLIAMAGDQINMAENAMMMIHPAQGGAFGDSTEMMKMAEILDKLDGQIASTYANRAGGSVEAFLAAMKEESWYTAEEALAAKLCTSVTPSKGVTAAFDRKILNKVSRRPDKIAAFLATIEGDDNQPPTSKFAVGDRIQVAGDPHNDGEDLGGVTGVTMEPCYCVRFDGKDLDSKYYAESELQVAPEESDLEDPEDEGDGTASDADPLENQIKISPEAVAVRLRAIEIGSGVL